MSPLNRFNRDITFNRAISAITRRVNNIQHFLAWNLPWGDTAVNKEKLQQYKNIHVGKRCFIIGNGPSIKSMDLDLLADEYTFGLNRIYLLFDQMRFRPSYFVSVNDLVLEQFADEIVGLPMPKFINWNLRKHYPTEDSTINYIKMGLGIQDKFHHDITKPISSGGTVTYVAMQIAYWMGFEEVVLIGVDHNFVDKGTPNKTEVRTSEVDQNHFHPNYFPKGSKWQLPDLQRSEIAYQLAKEAFEADGRRIIDATVGGKLQIFSKVNFYDLIG